MGKEHEKTGREWKESVLDENPLHLMCCINASFSFKLSPSWKNIDQCASLHGSDLLSRPVILLFICVPCTLFQQLCMGLRCTEGSIVLAGSPGCRSAKDKNKHDSYGVYNCILIFFFLHGMAYTVMRKFCDLIYWYKTSSVSNQGQKLHN